MSKKDKERRRTKKGLISVIYSHQKSTSKRRGHQPPTYTKEELKSWLYSQKLFHKLYDNWKRLDYQKMYIPSIDRKDDYIGYTIDNIQLMDWDKNLSKYHKDVKSGINNKRSRSVLKISKEGVLIAEYFSISSASRDTGVSTGDIMNVCKGKNKTAGGYIWMYKEKKCQ